MGLGFWLFWVAVLLFVWAVATVARLILDELVRAISEALREVEE